MRAWPSRWKSDATTTPVLPAEDKAEVVELTRSSGKTVGQVARELDLTETAVGQWVRQADHRLWVAGITQQRTGNGWLYLAVVLDAFSRRVVGWSMADQLRTELVLDALDMAIAQRKPAPGLVHHTDRGCR